MNLPRLPLALGLLLLLVAGCADEPEAADARRPASSASSRDGVDYPDVGLDFADLPDVKGVYAKALRTYVDFERGRREAAREGSVGRLLSFNATARVVDPYRRALSAYTGAPYGGDVVVEFLGAQPRDSVLRLDVCVDATSLEVPDGAPALLGEATRAQQRIEVTNIVGPWRVTRAESVGASC